MLKLNYWGMHLTPVATTYSIADHGGKLPANMDGI
jgi:hypothetical protein